MRLIDNRITYSPASRLLAFAHLVPAIPNSTHSTALTSTGRAMKIKVYPVNKLSCIDNKKDQEEKQDILSRTFA